MAGDYASGAAVHIDVPLSNLAIQAFQGSQGFVAGKLFPFVSVEKQTNKYYTIDKDIWLRINNTLRAPGTAPNQIEFKISSDAYSCNNYALRDILTAEDRSNADTVIALAGRKTQNIMDSLLRDYERRVALKCTSITNVGSGLALTGTAKWSAYTTSNPMADVSSGRAFIRSITGLTPNTAVLDYDTVEVLRRHPAILDVYKYTQGGIATLENIKNVLEVENLHIANGIYNSAKENATATMANIWGNLCLLAYVQPGNLLTDRTATFGVNFLWRGADEGMVSQSDPATPPIAARRYPAADPGQKAEYVEAGYYGDEKIVAKDLSYLINNTL